MFGFLEDEVETNLDLEDSRNFFQDSLYIDGKGVRH